MKIFSKVLIPETKKGMEYVITAKVDSIHPKMDSREGPYYFIQEVRKGTAKKIRKANFKQGKFYNHMDIIPT
tara:strand:+ start:134 stop:349 length:216 start_codon:yes stop_codon:yes gene_type:complete